MPRNVIAKRVRPFLLRRLKSDVLKELPEKIESVQVSRLLPDQKSCTQPIWPSFSMKR